MDYITRATGMATVGHILIICIVHQMFLYIQSLSNLTKYLAKICEAQAVSLFTAMLALLLLILFSRMHHLS